MICSHGISNFLKEISVFPVLLFCSILCTVPLKMLSYLFLLFSGTLHSDRYIFPFLLCLSLLFFSQLFCIFCLYLLVPNSIIYPAPTPVTRLVTMSVFSMSVSLSVLQISSFVSYFRFYIYHMVFVFLFLT